MTRRTGWQAAVLGGLLAAATAMPAAAQAPATPAPAASERPENLFALSARSGVLRPVRGRAGSFTLTLVHPSARVVSFTDRPIRNAGSLSIRNFVRSWPGYGFNSVPPNAVIEVPGARRSEDTFVISMRKPRYSRRLRSLTFDVRHDRGQHQLGAGLTRFERRADARVPQRFGTASLFIDSAPDFDLHYVRIQFINNTASFVDVGERPSNGSKVVEPVAGASVYQTRLPPGGSVYLSATQPSLFRAAVLDIFGSVVDADGNPSAPFSGTFNANSGKANTFTLSYATPYWLHQRGFDGSATGSPDVDITLTLDRPNQ